MNEENGEISSQLISILGCANKSWTISVWPFFEATSKGVELHMEIEYQKNIHKSKYYKMVKNKWHKR